VSVGAIANWSTIAPVATSCADKSYTGEAGWTLPSAGAVDDVITTSVSELTLPGRKDTCALPSALVALPPASAVMIAGGPRASVEDAEPVTGTVAGSVVTVVSTLGVACVESGAVVESAPLPDGDVVVVELVSAVWVPLVSALTVPLEVVAAETSGALTVPVVGTV
jgi:hypothetical protein